MPSGDGLLVRIKPFGGRLSAAALRAVAAAVEAYGNGVVELTGRGNLQVRGVWDAPAFAAAMVAAGLADADPVREARRNVVIVPPCDDALVAEAEAMMADTPGQAAKHYLVVDCTGIRSASPGPLTQPSPAGGRGLSLLQGEGGHLLHLPFGQTNAATLARLATLVPELRTTPWRAFLSATPVPGFDRPSTIIACVGAPGCASATVPARADAALLDAMGLTDMHVSGCAKGCAHPGPARTLVGRDGRYDLVRHGRASDPPDATGLTLEQAAAL